MHFMYIECAVYVSVPVCSTRCLMRPGTARVIILHLSRVSISGARSTWSRATLTHMGLQPPFFTLCPKKLYLMVLTWIFSFVTKFHTGKEIWLQIPLATNSKGDFPNWILAYHANGQNSQRPPTSHCHWREAHSWFGFNFIHCLNQIWIWTQLHNILWLTGPFLMSWSYGEHKQNNYKKQAQKTCEVLQGLFPRCRAQLPVSSRASLSPTLVRAELCPFRGHVRILMQKTGKKNPSLLIQRKSLL